MTYGENVGVIREQLAALLRQHRIQQRLGGVALHRSEPETTIPEREAMGRILRCYRDATLNWCHQALEAVGPKNDVRKMTFRDRTPQDDLRHRLDLTLQDTGTSGLVPLDMLAMEHRYDLMVRWQSIARAAALGEHDFAGEVNAGSLTPAQAITVARDAADIIRGLAVLDVRYKHVPGWTPVPLLPQLTRAAERVSVTAHERVLDLSVEDLGWRPPATGPEGPQAAGVAGAVQAQSRLLVELGRFPTALNLRRIIHAQVEVSLEAERHARKTAPELVGGFAERASVYRQLVAQSRNLGGLAGAGGSAVAESQNAISRLKNLALAATTQRASLLELHRLFLATDARVATTIEQGLDERVYFVAVRLPRMTDQQINGIYRPRTRYAPSTTRLQPGLLPLVRDHLQPAPQPAPQRPHSLALRHDYEAAIAHRPPPRNGPRR